MFADCYDGRLSCDSGPVILHHAGYRITRGLPVVIRMTFVWIRTDDPLLSRLRKRTRFADCNDT